MRWGLGGLGLEAIIEQQFSPPCGCALWLGRGQRLWAAANKLLINLISIYPRLGFERPFHHHNKVTTTSPTTAP